MSMMKRVYPFVIRATADRASVEARRLLEMGGSVLVIAGNKRRAKCFARLPFPNLVVIDYSIKTEQGVAMSCGIVEQRFDAIIFLRDTRAQLEDEIQLSEEETDLLAHHLLMQVIFGGSLLTFPAFDGAKNVFSLFPK